MKKDFLDEVVDACFEIYGKSPLIERGFIYGIGIKEWIKWLSYNSSNEEKRMLILIEKYTNQDCTKEEFYEVYNYMNNSIEDVILKKLTSNEIKEVDDKVLILKDLSDKELYEKIEIEKNDNIYNNLSMIDAYVLHKIIKIGNLRNEIELQKRLDLCDNENTTIARLSSVYSKNSRTCFAHPSNQNISALKSKVYQKTPCKSRT